MTARFRDRRLWLGGGAALAVLITLLAWIVVISPQRSSASATRAATTAALQRNAALQAENAKLKSQNDHVVALRGSLKAAIDALPSDSGLPALTRQLSQSAATNRIALTGVVVGAPAAAVTGTGVGSSPGSTTGSATGATPSTGTGTNSGTGAGTTTGTATGTPGSAPGTTTGSAKGAGGLVAIPVTLTTTGKGADQVAFLKAVQVTGPRRALVTSVQLAPLKGATVDGPTTMTLQLTVFSAPRDAAAQAALQKLLTGK